MEPRTTHRRVRWTHILGIILLLNGMSAAATLPIERQFPAPDEISDGMAFVGSDLWVWGVDLPHTFYVLDPENGAVKASHPSPAAGGSTGLTYDGSSVWAVPVWGVPSDGSYPQLMAKISPVDGSVISYYDLPVGNFTGITYDGQYLWVCGEGDDHSRILALDLDTMQPVRELTLPLGFLGDLAWDGLNLWMAAADWLGPDIGWQEYIVQIDPLTGSILGTFNAPGQAVVGLAWDNGLLYVSDPALDTIYVLRVPEPITFIYVVLCGLIMAQPQCRGRIF
ncbi:MAG: glutaminyl-peptide cyclotransferase [Phycisphaerae bacterium]|nr:glutaminyl-peptide cyclotransferase [Phycisphaerae bacterium]